MENQIKETIHHLLKTLECPICLEVLEDPVSTTCHHQFCRQCIIKVINTNNVKNQSSCPMCKTNISKRGLREKPFLSEVLATTKEIAKAIKLDSGIDVSPPKWSSCSGVNAVANSCSIEAFHRAHPSPYKPSSTGNNKRSMKEDLSVNATNKRFKSSTVVYNDGNTLDNANGMTISNTNVRAGFPAGKKKQINSDKAIPLLLPLIRGKENVTNSSPATFRLDFFPTEASSSRISDETSLIQKPAPNILLNAHFDQMKKLPNNESSKTDAIHNSTKTYARKKFDKTRLSTSCLDEMDVTEKVSQWLTTQSKESGTYLDTSSVDSSHLSSSKKFFKSKDSFYQDSEAVLPKLFPDEDPYAFISSQKTPPKTKKGKGAKPKGGRKYNKNPSVLVPKNMEMVKKLSKPSTSKQRQPFTNLEDDNDFVTTKTIREKVVKMQPPVPKVNLPDSLVEPDDDLDDIVLFQTPACDITDYSNKNGTFVNSDNENESEFGITKKRSKVGKKGGGTVKKSRKSRDPNLPSTQEQIDRMNEKLAEAENFELNIEYIDTKQNENHIQNNKFDELEKPNDNFIIADSENILSRKEKTKSPIKAITIVESIQSPRKPLGQANRLNEGDAYVLETGSKKTPSKISTPDRPKSLKPAIILKNIVPLGITALQESKPRAHNSKDDLILVNNPGKSKLELPPLLSRNIAALSHFDENLEPVIDVKSDSTDKTELYSPDIKSKHPENSLHTEFAPNNIGDLKPCEGQKSTVITDMVLKKRNCFSTSTEIDPVETARPNLNSSSSDVSFSNIQLLQSPIMNIVAQVEISKDSSSKLELEESSKLELKESSKLELEESSKLELEESSKLELEVNSKLKPSNESIPKSSKDHRSGSSKLQLEESASIKHNVLQEPVTISEKQSSSNDFLPNEEQCVQILHEITTTVDVLNSIQEVKSLKIIDVGMENIDTISSSTSISSIKSLDATKEKIKGFITQLFKTDESDTSSKEEYSANEDVISDGFINEKNVNENIIEPMEVEQSCEINNDEEMVKIVMSIPKKALMKCSSNVDSENVQMPAIGCSLKLHFNADIKFDPQKNTYYVNSGSISVANQPSFLVGSNTNTCIFKDIEAQTDVTSSNSKSVGTLTDNSIFGNVPSVSNSTVQTDSTIKVMENFEAQTDISLSSKSVSTETEASMNEDLPEMGSQTELTMSCLDLLLKNVDSHSTLKNLEFPNLIPNHYGVALQTSKIEGLDPSWGSIPEDLSPMFPSNTSVEGENEEPKHLGSTTNEANKFVAVRSSNMFKNENPSKSIDIDVEQKMKSFNVENDHSTMKSDNIEDKPVLKSIIDDDQPVFKSIIEKNQTTQEQELNGETITIQIQEDIFQSSPFTNENTTVNKNNPSIVSKTSEIIPSAEKIPHEILARFFSQSALNDTEDTNMDFNQSVHSDSRSSDHGENGHDTKLEDDFLQDNDSFIIGKEHDDLFVEKLDFDKVIEKPVEMNVDEFVEETDDQFGNESNDIFGITIINQEPPEHKSPKKHIEDNQPKEETRPNYSPQSFSGKAIEIKRDVKSPESPLVPVRRASRLSRKKRVDKSFSSNSSNSYSTKNSGKLLSGTSKSPLNGIPEENKRIANVKANDYCDLPNDEFTRKSPLKAICQENAKKTVNFDTTNYRDISSDEASNLEDEHPTKARIDEDRINQMDDEDSLPDSNERLQNLLRNNYSVRHDDPSMQAAESTVAPLQSSLMKRNIEQPNLRNQKLFSNSRELNEKRLDSTSGENSSPLIRKETKKFVRQLNYDSPSDSTASWKPATRKFIKNRVISDSDSESEPEIPVVLISTDSEVDTPKTAMKKVLDNIQRDLDFIGVKPLNEDVELSTEDFDPSRDDVEPSTDDIIENRVDCTSTMSFTGSNLVEQQMQMDSLRNKIAVLKSLYNSGATQKPDDNVKAQTPKKDDQVPNDESPKNSQDDGNESEDIFDSEIPPTPPLKSKKGSGNFLR